jgi:hypothetical protein
MITRFNTVREYTDTLQAAIEISCDASYSRIARQTLGEFAADLIENFRIDDHGATRVGADSDKVPAL